MWLNNISRCLFFSLKIYCIFRLTQLLFQAPLFLLFTSDVGTTSPMTSPAILRRSSDLVNNINNSMMDPLSQEQCFQQQILHLKEQQRLQQEILLQQFHQQQQQLAEQHEKQLQQHFKVK